MLYNIWTRLKETVLDLTYLLKHVQKGQETFITSMEQGELRITRQAVQDIIKYSLQEIRGIAKLKIILSPDEGGLEILIFCQIDESHNFLVLSEKIRQIIRSKVELSTGLMVKEVKVKRDEQLLGNNQRKNS